MSASGKEELNLSGQQAVDPAIATWLAALADSRERTLNQLKKIDSAHIDWTDSSGATIGSTLYHIAAIEFSWLFEDVLEDAEWTDEMSATFPHPVRDGDGHLTPVTGESRETHLARLAWVRGQIMETFTSMSLEDFHRPRELEEHYVTPAWVIHHLLQHEAEHRSLIEKLGQEAQAAD